MSKERIPVTPAILFMKKHEMAFTLRPYRYEEHGGTRVSARELGVDEHLVVKTLVMEDDSGEPLIILMNGGPAGLHQVARPPAGGQEHRSLRPPRGREAHRLPRRGGLPPFGTKKNLRLFMEEEISALPKILINAGSPRAASPKWRPRSSSESSTPLPSRWPYE